MREEYDAARTRAERVKLFDFNRRPLYGESFSDVALRATAFLKLLQESCASKDVVIVSHGEFIKVLLLLIDGNSSCDFHLRPNIKNCQIDDRFLLNNNA
jgi:broad specificity phosphatase PhoE